MVSELEGNMHELDIPLDFSVTKNQLEIMVHTRDRASGRRFCGGGIDMDKLVKMGLMKSLGRVSFVPDEYFTLTEKGEDFIKDINNL